jgi:hypothetical protein
MNFLKIIWSFIFVILLFQSCSKPTDSVTSIERSVIQKSEIPNFIIAIADSFLISKVGPTFFLNYIKYDSSRSEYLSPDKRYRMVYTFRIPEKSWIDETIEFALDSVSSIVLESSTYGIPECVSIPSCCVFGIDSVTAIGIARQAGLEDGIKPWQVTFYWFGGNIKNYVWGISNTISEWSGKVVVIDANSGVVIDTLCWVANS